MCCDFDLYNTIDLDYFLTYTIVKVHDVDDLVIQFQDVEVG